MDHRVVAAADNNARWCDLVCKTHRVQTAFRRGHWLARRRPPRLYPDAVTLQPDVRADDVLRLIDDGPGCSVKDSFAALSPPGFDVLFEARWIVREPAPVEGAGSASAWSQVRTTTQLADWARAAGTGEAILPDLLGDTSVRILRVQGPDGIAAGAIANRTGSVVGVSNVFTTTMPADEAWSGLARVLDAENTRLVGYERDEPLRAALASGFTEIGALAVWRRGPVPGREGPAIEFRACAMDEEPAASLAQGMRDEIAVMYDGLALDGPDMPRAGLAELSPPGGTFIVGFDAGVPVCCGGLKRLPDGACEIKKMFVVAEARGRGAARALLVELERRARDLGYEIARLDTGPKQTRAQLMYERAGYAPVANFNANPVATFFGEKVL